MGAIIVMLLTVGMPARESIARCLSLLPAGLMAVAWYPRMTEFRAGMGITPAGDSQRYLLERLDPEFLVQAFIGGIPSSIESVVRSVIAIWIAAGVIQGRHQLRDRVDQTMLVAASVLVALYLALPERFF